MIKWNPFPKIVPPVGENVLVTAILNGQSGRDGKRVVTIDSYNRGYNESENFRMNSSGHLVIAWSELPPPSNLPMPEAQMKLKNLRRK